MGDTSFNDYTWIQFSTENNILYKNGTLLDDSYSYAVFDNATFTFLYIFNSTKSAFACVRSSDKTFLDIYTVVQCPQSIEKKLSQIPKIILFLFLAVATKSTKLSGKQMGPIAYEAAPGSEIILYCDISNSKINNVVWGFVKKNSSPQYIWSYMTGFANTTLAKTYYNIIFDNNSLNLSISGVTAEDMDLLYFCADVETDINIVFIELVESLATGE